MRNPSGTPSRSSSRNSSTKCMPRARARKPESRQLNQWLKEEVSTRTAELQRERMKLERLSIATLEALVNALEAKDPYMRGHSARVADLSATVAHELGIPEEDVELVRV